MRNYGILAFVFCSYVSLFSLVIIFMDFIGADDFSDYYNFIVYTFCAFSLLSLLLSIANIIFAVKTRKYPIIHSFRSLMLYKLSLIPFFIVIFITCLIFMMITFHPLFIFLWALIPVVIIYIFIVLVTTYAYIIPKINDYCNRGILTDEECFWHIVFQLLFVTDIIGSIYFARTEKQFIDY